MHEIKMYFWKKIRWSFDHNSLTGNEWVARCPRKGCNYKLGLYSGISCSNGKWKYQCNKCNCQIELDEQLCNIVMEVPDIVEAEKYKDAEIINIDGELTKILSQRDNDSDYWIEAKISKNHKGERQLMVLAGEKNAGSKTQLFLEAENEKMTFDQNDHHPSEVFAKVEATFRKSKSKISGGKK